MANVSKPGAWPVGTVSGSPWQGGVREFKVLAGADEIYLGDFVTLKSDGTVDRTVLHSSRILGACVGVNPVEGQSLGGTTLSLSGATQPALAQKYSSGAGTVLVACAPDTIFEMDASAAVEGQTNIGQTANITHLVRGSNTTGLSGHVVNISQIGTSSAAQLRIIDIPDRVDNTVNEANCHVLVVVNMHEYAPNAAGV